MNMNEQQAEAYAEEMNIEDEGLYIYKAAKDSTGDWIVEVYAADTNYKVETIFEHYMQA